jgi:hypothetical protein
MRAHSEKILPATKGKGFDDVNVGLALMYFAYWFSGMFVLIEGYKSIGITEPAIEELLKQQDKVDILRRYRNTVYHFQPEYFDDRNVAFMNSAGSMLPWLRDLRIAFSRFIEEWLKTHDSDGNVI